MDYDSTQFNFASDPNFVSPEFSSMEETSKVAPVEADGAKILEFPTQEERSKPLSSKGQLEPLSPKEQEEREHLEQVIEQGFDRAAEALVEIRDRRLYRSTHKSFAAYCKDKLRSCRRKIDYSIHHTKMRENLSANHAQDRMNGNLSANHALILPTKPEQTKYLAKLNPEEQRQIWYKAVEVADGRVPSGKIVQEIAAQYKPEIVAPPKKKQRELIPNGWQVGDVFTLSGLKGGEQKYNGCWAIAKELTDSTVIAYDATLTVKPNNLDKIDAPNVEQLWQRITRLLEVGSFDPGVVDFLKGLGKHTAPLTPVQEGMLSWLENHYEV
jgi:hypothetical protein